VASQPFTNHPVCAAEERDLLIDGAATPPLKGGEWTRLVIKSVVTTAAVQPGRRRRFSFQILQGSS